MKVPSSMGLVAQSRRTGGTVCNVSYILGHQEDMHGLSAIDPRLRQWI